MLVRNRERQKLAVVRGGFTLMEMLVVVAIIVVLAGIGGYYLLPRLDEAKEDADLIEMKNIDQAVATYHIPNDRWPGNLDELGDASANGGSPLLDKSHLVSKSTGEPFKYDPSGSHNGGTKPDIYIETHRGQTIGNWMAKVPR